MPATLMLPSPPPSLCPAMHHRCPCSQGPEAAWRSVAQPPMDAPSGLLAPGPVACTVDAAAPRRPMHPAAAGPRSNLTVPGHRPGESHRQQLTLQEQPQATAQPRPAPRPTQPMLVPAQHWHSQAARRLATALPQPRAAAMQPHRVALLWQPLVLRLSALETRQSACWDVV
jgi:hypothetical protein